MTVNGDKPAVEVRELGPDELDAAKKVVALSFSGDPDSDWATLEGALWPRMKSHGAFLGDRLVGHAGGFDFPMSIPGSTTRVLGVTNVGVSPLARRRGVATALMRSQLETAHLDGYAAAALWASEPRIYGRFGYGNAADLARLTVVRNRSWLREVPGSDEVVLTPVERGDAAGLVRSVQNAVAATRPGLFPWDDDWARIQVDDTPGLRSGSSPLQIVRAERNGRTTGYAMWRNKGDWSPGYPSGAVEVRDVRALDAATHAGIWGLLLDYDLMGRTTVTVPVDDVLLTLLDERRSAKVTISDALHVRLLDVGHALAARRYRGEVDTVLEIRDTLLPWNTNRWRLIGNRAGATCVVTSDDADLSLDVRDLAAVWLGGGSLLALQRAGLVAELVPGAAAPVAHAFGWDIAPYSDVVF